MKTPLTVVFLISVSFCAASPLFLTPIEGEPYKDWTVVNYVDLNSGTGVLDYFGGAYSYNGHEGTDFTLPHFLAMDTGCDAYAASGGVVTAVHDGEYDRNTAMGSYPVNYVTIDHGNGWITKYLHLRRNSISVSIGASVTGGQKIAQVGSSGSSTDAHLHFEVRHNGAVVDPFKDQLWAAPIAYAGSSPGILDVGMTDHFPSTAELKEGAKKSIFFSPSALCVHWIHLFDVKTPDVLKWQFYTPAGALYKSYSYSLTELIRYGWYYAGWTLPGNQKGRWNSKFSINGVVRSQVDFFASSGVDSDSDGVYDDAEKPPLVVGADDSILDTDGDGSSNTDEFMFGTDALDSASRPLIRAGLSDTGELRLEFRAVENRRVFVQSNASLTTNGWVNYRHICAGTNRSVKIALDTFGDSRFFRLRSSFDE